MTGKLLEIQHAIQSTADGKASKLPWEEKMAPEVKLKPGWLRVDIAKASERVSKSGSPPESPPKPVNEPSQPTGRKR
jgi:hypothetical protein